MVGLSELNGIRHYPVMVGEILTELEKGSATFVVDATLGGAGHAEAILDRFDSIKLYIGLDKDQQAVKRSESRLQKYVDRFKAVHSDFTEIEQVARRFSNEAVDFILFDLGVSSFHFDDPERGFSFSKDGPLDMRLDKNSNFKASDLINNYSKEELTRIFREYGEIRNAGSLANAIVKERDKSKIETTLKLAEIVKRYTKERYKKIDPATKVFMSIRIAVNDELKKLSIALKRSVDLLKSKGLLAVISFHSLEDRIVKNFFFENLKKCICDLSAPLCICGEPGLLEYVNKRVIKPSTDEISHNKRSRSAKLRMVRKI